MALFSKYRLNDYFVLFGLRSTKIKRRDVRLFSSIFLLIKPSESFPVERHLHITRSVGVEQYGNISDKKFVFDVGIMLFQYSI